jgi:RimJ/RimL family protein N-acetyltransferase
VIELEKLSNIFKVKKLKEDDIDSIYDLCSKNTYYYQFCPPFVTKDSIKNDMYVLPPNRKLDDKYYIGFYNEDELVAIMDLIVNYPKNNTCYIGLFMIDIEKQNRGIGSKIINELFVYLYNKGFQGVELGYVEQNIQAKRFWLKNGFEIIGSQQQELFNVICMRKVLKGSGKNE